MKRPEVYRFFDANWQEDLYLVNGATTDQMTAFGGKTFEEPNFKALENTAGACAFSWQGKGIIIFLRFPFELSPAGISTLAHECFHAAEFILQSRSISHGDQTREVYAYLMDSILRRFLELLAKKRGK